MIDLESRKEILFRLGAESEDLKSILEYNNNLFQDIFKYAKIVEDESFAEVWQSYLDESKNKGIFNILKEKFVQFKFPIAENISLTKEYKDATLKGIHKGILYENFLKEPDKLKLSIYSSTAGRIPIIYTPCRNDFELIVRTFTMKNEPKKIPRSIGAFFIKGYNNWDRINKYRLNLLDETNKNIIPSKEFYQDKFIILSGGPYSGISSEEMNIPEEQWLKISFLIRREHECTHYYTSRVYGSARNNLLDEIIADTIGIIEAKGEFSSQWLLKFMGLGRIENYRGDYFHSENAWSVMKRLVTLAAKNLEKLNDISDIKDKKIYILNLLCSMTLEEIATKENFINL